MSAQKKLEIMRIGGKVLHIIRENELAVSISEKFDDITITKENWLDSNNPFSISLTQTDFDLIVQAVEALRQER